MYFKFLQRRHGRSGLSPEGGSYSRLPAELDWFDVAPLHLHQPALWKTLYEPMSQQTYVNRTYEIIIYFCLEMMI